MSKQIAFICSQFPCYDEAFILREIDSLSKRLEGVIFSLKPSRDRTVHDEALKLKDRTLYLPYLFSLKLLAAHLSFLCRAPWAYVSTLLTLIYDHLFCPEFLIKNLALFPQAVLIAREVQKRGIAHVHGYWATYPASVSWIVHRLTGVPFSFTGHAHDIYLKTAGLARKIRAAAFVVTCTRANKTYLEQLAPDAYAEKILSIYHGIDLDKYQNVKPSADGKFQILSVGTLQAHKGFKFFLSALSELKHKQVPFQAVIIGGGPLEDELRRQIQELGLSGEVLMTGSLKQSEVIPYYHQAHVHVLMAQSEWHWGIPNVIIESLAAQAAVITTRFGSVEELVKDQETGLLIPSKDAEKLAAALERLYRDEAFRTRIARAGYERVSTEFDLKKNIALFEECLKNSAEGVAILNLEHLAGAGGKR